MNRGSWRSAGTAEPEGRLAYLLQGWEARGVVPDAAEAGHSPRFHDRGPKLLALHVLLHLHLQRGDLEERALGGATVARTPRELLVDLLVVGQVSDPNPTHH